MQIKVADSEKLAWRKTLVQDKKIIGVTKKIANKIAVVPLRIV